MSATPHLPLQLALLPGKLSTYLPTYLPTGSGVKTSLYMPSEAQAGTAGVQYTYSPMLAW